MPDSSIYQDCFSLSCQACREDRIILHAGGRVYRDIPEWLQDGNAAGFRICRHAGWPLRERVAGLTGNLQYMLKLRFRDMLFVFIANLARFGSRHLAVELYGGVSTPPSILIGAVACRAA